jgi:hypothetical protein
MSPSRKAGLATELLNPESPQISILFNRISAAWRYRDSASTSSFVIRERILWALVFDGFVQLSSAPFFS